MNLSSEILPFTAGETDSWCGRYYNECLAGEGEPVDVHNAAITSANSLYKARPTSDIGLPLPDALEWRTDDVSRLYGAYMDQFNIRWDFHRGIQRDIRRCLAKWRRSKARGARRPFECVKSQIRGAWLKSQSEAGGRTDPTYVFGWKSARGLDKITQWEAIENQQPKEIESC